MRRLKKVKNRSEDFKLKQRLYALTNRMRGQHFAIKFPNPDRLSRALKFYTVDKDDPNTTHWLSSVTDKNGDNYILFTSLELFTVLTPNPDAPKLAVDYLNGLMDGLVDRINKGDFKLIDIFNRMLLERVVRYTELELPMEVEA